MEVLLLSERDGRLRYRAQQAPLESGWHPDDLAACLAAVPVCDRAALLHSTSWRYEGGAVVLTYAALPDPQPDPVTFPLSVDAMVYSPGPLAPSPPHLDLDGVAAHAGRHLALLLATDPVVQACALGGSPVWELVGKLAPSPAGSPFPPRSSVYSGR
jgi:hypothetical protein